MESDAPLAVGDVPIRPVAFLPRDVERTTRADGSMMLRSRIPLRAGRPHLPAYLRHFADVRPDATWVAQRVGEDRRWRHLSYGEAQARVDQLTQGLLDHNGDDRRPLAILSGNSIEHALILLAAMQARIPVVGISPAYSLQATDFARLRHMIDVVDPAVFFVQHPEPFAAALATLDRPDALVLHAGAAAPPGLSLHALAAPATDAVAASVAAIDPDAPARLMFTSGSTGAPKAVIHTQRTIVEPVESQAQALGVDDERPIVRLDWTPWNHIFGATSLALATASGGTIYIDDGRPSPTLFDETVRNLRDIAPTSYGSVPAGFAALVEALERDDALRERFFSRLEYVSYAAARLPDDIGERLEALSVRTTGQRIAITTGYGSTETTTAGAFVHWPTTQTGMIGLPQPGIEMKLAPFDADRYEVRLRGIGITPGYHRQPEATAAAFDEEGYYRTGDTAAFLDPADPDAGLVFTGRIAEEFKLQTGIFVKVGTVRTTLLDQCAPFLQDAVICGENETYVSAMAWIDLAAARRLTRRPDADRADLNADTRVRDAIATGLLAYNAAAAGSSARIRRLVLLDTAASPAVGEITDKGSINQAVSRRYRAETVAALFSAVAPAHAIEPAAAVVG